MGLLSMRLVKSLLIFGVCGTLLIISAAASIRDVLNSTLIGLVYDFARFLQVALAIWIIFNIVIAVLENLLAVALSRKNIEHLDAHPVWSVVISSVSYYMLVSSSTKLCPFITDSEKFQFFCALEVNPSVVQILAFGIVCGWTLTCLSRPKSISFVEAKKQYEISSWINHVVSQVKKLWWMLPILITLIVFFLFYDGYFPLKGADLEERGQFGDSFGVLNSLFSGLGFGGLIITLLYQQKQISHQKEESKVRREFEEVQHYEEVFYRILSIYSKTLDEVISKKGDLVGRQVLRGSIDRVYSSLRTHNVNAISQVLQGKYEKKKLSKEESLLIDYVYFRNFKILSVEIEKQNRLVETFKLLLRHTARSLPIHLDGKPYFDLIKSQLNHTEASYFFLVALTFEDEADFRELIGEAHLYEKIASTKIIRVHEMMYKDFWGVDIRKHKIKKSLPMVRKRVDQAVRAFERLSGEKPSTDLRRYTPVKVRMSEETTIDIAVSNPASNQADFENT